MKRFLRNAFVTVLALILLLLPAAALPARAATFADINQVGVFLRQETNYTCPLASAAMLIRRTAIMMGNADWAAITESALRPTAWKEGSGMWYNFTYAGVSVGHVNKDDFTATSLAALLANHPEGIIIYNGGNENQWHAVLLTDYTDGVFYCADPAKDPARNGGRIPLASSTIKGATVNDKIANITSYWYVKSPAVSFTTAFTVSFNANGGEGAPANQTKAVNAALTLSSDRPVRRGYSFTGWNTASDGSGTPFAPGAQYTADADLVLYAQWERILYGDADGNGAINNRDVVRLKNYLANVDEATGLSTVEIFPGADADGNGALNNRDVVRLKNYLANVDDETGLSTVTLGPA